MKATNNLLTKTFSLLMFITVPLFTVSYSSGQTERDRFSNQARKMPVVINQPTPTDPELLTVGSSQNSTDNSNVIFVGTKNGLLRYFDVREKGPKVAFTTVSMNQKPIRQIYFDGTGYLLKGSAIFSPLPIGIWGEYFDYQKTGSFEKLIPEFWQIGFSAPNRACLVGVNLRRDNERVDSGLLICNQNMRQNPENWMPPKLPARGIEVKIPSQLTGIHFKGERGWLVGANGIIWQTETGGREWDEQESKTKSALLSIYAVDRDNVWAVGFEGTILRYSRNANGSGNIERSENEKTDSKTTQNPQKPNPRNPKKTVELPRTILNQTIIISGSTEKNQNFDKLEWRPFEIKSISSNIRLWNVKFANNGKNGWIVGDSGTILYTSDGGDNWEKISLPFLRTLPNFYGLHVDERSAWIVGGQGVVLRFDY